MKSSELSDHDVSRAVERPSACDLGMKLHSPPAHVKAMALIREFHDGTARKDWEAWGLDMIASLRAALAREGL